MTDDAKTLAERGGRQAMNTCGECVHFEAGQHGRYGYCRCDAVDGVALGSRATRTARLAEWLALYSPRAGKALLGEGKGGNR
jgi:hypothetical protein